MRESNKSLRSSGPFLRICLTSLLAGGLFLTVANHALATVTNWNGPSTGGVFNDDNNWDQNSPGDNTPPPAGAGPNDFAVFGGGSNVNVDGTITFDANVTHANARIENSAGTISFDTGTHKWTMTSYIDIKPGGVDGFPIVKHIGGEIQAGFLLFGTSDASSNAMFELTGANTHFHTTITGGGYQIGTGPNANGTTMLVHNGAKMTAVGQTIVGLQGSRNSNLIIDGPGTVFQGGNYLAAGHTPEFPTFGQTATNSTIEITNGASATAAMLYMAIQPGASDDLIRVSGIGTKLTLTGVNNNDGAESRIGWRDNNNLLRVENGAVVDGTNRFNLGVEATSNAGNQIQIDNGSLFGTKLDINRGSVTVTNGTVDLIQYFNESPTVMAYEGGGINAPTVDGTFTFNSGTVRSVNANINNGSAFTVGDGGGTSATYFMRKDIVGARGAHTFAGGLALASNGILSGDGDIVGNVSGSAGAKVQVGASPGLINDTGDWNNTGIGIALELGNLSASLTPGVAFDQLNITGAFTHGGSLTIDRSQLVAAASNQQLKLVGWGSEVGLSSSTAVAFTGGSPLSYNFLSDGFYVTVPGGGLPGDYNNNGTVDAADYVVWRKNPAAFGGTPGGYNTWRANFGKPPGSGGELAHSTALPEPASSAIVLIASVISCVACCRSRANPSQI